MSVLPTLLLVLGSALCAQDDLDLTDLSLEQLMGMELTSAARKEQTLLDTAAAVYVITRDDIRRSGATSLPEVLRLAPGVHVARISGNSWAVTVRGFNDRYTNKLLVMVDGRSIYTNAFSGILWESLAIPLDLIERVEVIRGPGGTMWGANAVNGVINVITRSADDTQGSELHLSAGDPDLGFATVIHGGDLEDGAWRAHAFGGLRDDQTGLDGGSGSDDWSGFGAGFRADWGDPEGDAFLVTADVTQSQAQREFPLLDPTIPAPLLVDETFEYPGASLLGRWTRALDDGELSLAGFLDYHRIESGPMDDERTTLDLDLQHRRRLGADHELVWGLGYRVTAGRFRGLPAVDMRDESRTDHLFSAFAQDEMQVTDDLRLTFGAKVEHNALTGLEVQPSARALLRVDERSSAWAAVSRAVRTPSLIEHELVLPIGFMPGTPPVMTVLMGSEDFESENLLAYEIGYRTQATERLLIDVTAFYFDYDHLATFELGAPVPGPVVIQPLFFDNLAQGTEVGVELAFDWQVHDRWRLRGAGSVSDVKIETDDASTDATADDEEVGHPTYLANVSSHLSLSETVDLDLVVYAVDELERQGIDAYVRADARLAWRPRAGLELALGVQNLNDDAHQEFFDDFTSGASEIERAVYASVHWRP
jgi:iron complex outermembrane receptor protein